jgi:hypothetical protein
MAGRIAMKPKVDQAVDGVYEDFHTEVEGELLNSLVNLYQTKVDRDVASPTVMNLDAGNLSNVAFSSIFANKASVIAFVLNPDRLKLDADPLLKIATGIVTDQKLQSDRFAKVEENFAKNNRIYLEGMMKSQPNKSFYPDANGTMRLTYGTVDTLPIRTDRNYHGVTENYYTDMAGMVAKYKKGDEEFDLPQRLIDLHNMGDYGQYADAAGYMPVNFLSNNDITGGNSGSPVIDGDGNLIGIAFDGNSEALSGDIVFEKDWQKTINVDIRYVLWTIDKFAGASRLIQEMTLVTDENTPKDTKTVMPKAADSKKSKSKSKK